MARLTDRTGRLLGGHHIPHPQRLVSSAETKTASVLAPPMPPAVPVYAPGEIVFGLRCSLGSLAYLTFSAPDDVADTSERRTVTCQRLIEEPEERHFCTTCGGYYCAVHAAPAAHECRSALRTK